MLRSLTVVLAVVAGALFLSCGGDDESEEATPTPTVAETEEATASPTEAPTGKPTVTPTEAPTASDTPVTVQMSPDGLTTDPEEGPPGLTSFEITNNTGASCSFAIVTNAGAPDALPTTSAGEYDRAAGGPYVLAQTPGISDGATTELPYELEAGSYVLICIGTDEDGLGLYGKGVFAAFTVE